MKPARPCSPHTRALRAGITDFRSLRTDLYPNLVKYGLPTPACNHNDSSRSELMPNFFAQPDALAAGKTAEEVAAEGTPAHLAPHEVFPSSFLLFPRLDAYSAGQLLALYRYVTRVARRRHPHRVCYQSIIIIQSL